MNHVFQRWVIGAIAATAAAVMCPALPVLAADAAEDIILIDPTKD